MHRIYPLFKLALTVVVVVALIEALVFRSGAYTPWIKFKSTAGSVVASSEAIDQYFDASRRNVLVLGNSQIGEGFSPALVDNEARASGVHFVNGAVPGTTPRVWNYLLRDVDPRAERFAAIALMVNCHASYGLEDFANYPLDTNYVAPLLRLSDIADYPWSFTRSGQRQRALRAILFPLMAMRDDVFDFIIHPGVRIESQEHERPGWIDALARYAGHTEQVPALHVDPASGMPIDWGSTTESDRRMLEKYLRGARATNTPELYQANEAYEWQWIGRIARRYHANGATVAAFCMPRGPWMDELRGAPEYTATLRTLRDEGLVTLLAATAFTDLEQPQFFFDTLHLNHAGRERFSTTFAQLILPLVEVAPH